MTSLDGTLSSHKVHRIDVPEGLPQDAFAVASALELRRADLERRAATANSALAKLDAAHGVADALGELARGAWLVAHVPEMPATEHFAWVTGWCAGRDDRRLREALDTRGLHYLLRTDTPPPGLVPPSVLRNPRWVQPFETITRMMGVPAAGEADPSMLVAVLAPLMFGYMFGDVAQGAMVALAGLWLGRRWPALRLLWPGGLAAIAFGLAFGSVFAREDVIAPAWLHPLAEPLPVLAAALVFGVATLSLGLAVDALQHAWTGRLRAWLLSDAGLLCAYLGLAVAPLDAHALWAVPCGLLWTFVGAAVSATNDRRGAAAKAAGESLERILQLTVNTVSFVRVGAFALAHAGLCTAVVGLAEASGSGYWPVLIIGNVAIVALEGLVVSIQTTRLVLFEFFVRFVTARGRPFEPLALPPASPTGDNT
jgi:V/A-type H+-transporting ATPase subunit I